MMLSYFAYGSNLSSKRLQQRLQVVRPQGVYILGGYQCQFNVIAGDQSAKCNIVPSHEESFVLGVLYHITDAEKTQLDSLEKGYSPISVMVGNSHGEDTEAFVYVSSNNDLSQQPYQWYKHHILTGMQEFKFPLAYVESIQTINAKDDVDKDRVKREMAIYDF